MVYDQKYVDELTNFQCVTTTALTLSLFHYIFLTYCGEGTPIKSTLDLFLFFNYLKEYPEARVYGEHTRIRFVTLLRRVKRWARFLAKTMQNLQDDVWDKRRELPRSTDIPQLFGHNCHGNLDVVPIHVRRPTNPILSRAFYSGKYKFHVVKFQVLSSFQGIPLYFSGPFIGCRADPRLWQEHRPDLDPQECYLADKAYEGAIACVSPMKKRPKVPGGGLTPLQVKRSAIINWFRATVEHGFAQYKKWKAFREVWRGHLINDASVDFLTDCFSTITSTLILQIRHSPLKSLSVTLLPPPGAPLGHVFERQYHDNLPLGDPDFDAAEIHDRTAIGVGPSPDDMVATGYIAADFRTGQDVLFCWWGLWWRATVLRFTRSTNSVYLKISWSGKYTNAYPSRLVRPFP